MGATVSVGEEFYDILPDGRYERCILQKTDGSEPDRHASARGGTGEFYRPISPDIVQAELRKEESARLDASVEIWEPTPNGFGKMVFLERVTTAG